jgi:hypothetical protein
MTASIIWDCAVIFLARLGSRIHPLIVGFSLFSFSFATRYSTGRMYPKWECIRFR